MVEGISTDAEWLWSDENFNADMGQYVVFRTHLTIVSEPTSLALMGPRASWVRALPDADAKSDDPVLQIRKGTPPCAGFLFSGAETMDQS